MLTKVKKENNFIYNKYQLNDINKLILFKYKISN